MSILSIMRKWHLAPRRRRSRKLRGSRWGDDDGTPPKVDTTTSVFLLLTVQLIALMAFVSTMILPHVMTSGHVGLFSGAGLAGAVFIAAGVYMMYIVRNTDDSTTRVTLTLAGLAVFGTLVACLAMTHRESNPERRSGWTAGGVMSAFVVMVIILYQMRF